MKTHLTVTLAVITLLSQAHGQNVAGPVMRDASTNAQLTLEYRKALQNNPMRKLEPAKGEDPSHANQPEDLVASSDFLCFGGMATLVPKRAVLNVPKNLLDRMKFQPGSQIRGWADFYALNRGWITTVEVSRPQAEGNQEMKAEIIERIGKSTNLVVATYMGGPISVLPLKVPEKKEADASTQTVKVK